MLRALLGALAAPLLISPTIAAQEGRDPPSAPDSAQAASAIAVLMDAWLEAYEAGDIETLENLFLEGAVYAANTGQLLRGRAGIREGVRGWLARRPQIFANIGAPETARLNLEARLLRFRTLGDAAYTLTRFHIEVEPMGCWLDAGHAMTVWRRQADDGWLIESHLVNQDREPPPEACARRAERASP